MKSFSKKINNKKFVSGYTLVELLTVTSIMVVVLGLIVGILYSTLRGTNKTRITNDVSQNGNYALSIISNTALLAESVSKVDGNSYSDCTTERTGKSIEFVQQDGRRISFACGTVSTQQETIASSSGSTTSYLIDNNAVKVDPTTCNFSCIQSDANPYSLPIIRVSFTVSQRSSAALFEGVAKSEFSTSVTMRNYNPR